MGFSSMNGVIAGRGMRGTSRQGTASFSAPHLQGQAPPNNAGPAAAPTGSSYTHGAGMQMTGRGPIGGGPPMGPAGGPQPQANTGRLGMGQMTVGGPQPGGGPTPGGGPQANTGRLGMGQMTVATTSGVTPTPGGTPTTQMNPGTSVQNDRSNTFTAGGIPNDQGVVAGRTMPSAVGPQRDPQFDPNDPNNAALAGYQMAR